jgi:mannose/cellobiose epimerase-like protein (N-acyl-D-glucosamine 2-epimerase family)
MTTQPLPASSWLNARAHHAWLATEGQRLLSFAKASRLPEGFGNLDDHGVLPPDAVAETMNTARMTHSFAMAHGLGLPGYAELVEHGVAALSGPLRDARHGGWFAKPNACDGNTGKAAYLHAFVALAASSAVVAGASGAQTLLNDATHIIDQYFWSEEEGAMLESFAQDWKPIAVPTATCTPPRRSWPWPMSPAKPAGWTGHCASSSELFTPMRRKTGTW